MRIVVHRVDAPGVARAVVGRPHDPVDHRVAHMDVRRPHVNPGPQGACAVRKLPGPHAAEQIEVLRNRPLTVRTGTARLGEVAAVQPDLLRRQVADVGLAPADQLLGTLAKPAEVVRGVVLATLPVEAEPAHVLADGVDVLGLLLAGIGVVKAQVAGAAELARDPEVDADRLGVADVQVAVRLGRKTGVNPAAIAARGHIGPHNLADKVQPRRLAGRAAVRRASVSIHSPWFRRCCRQTAYYIPARNDCTRQRKRRLGETLPPP
ncbi:MAG: hypothetical protein BWZ02_02311 [Lentisphaerae bacterium ADurb.BinA184]|nr:MAG: hypothetical protein BWZ02_02311 [Lentisphaerae bacterium ADurb.BinA184]